MAASAPQQPCQRAANHPCRRLVLSVAGAVPKTLLLLLLLCLQVKKMQEAGYVLGNLDATIIAQKPKLSPHKVCLSVCLLGLLAWCGWVRELCSRER